MGPAYELDAVLRAATDPLIPQALSSVGWPRSGKNLSRHRSDAKASTSTPCGVRIAHASDSCQRGRGASGHIKIGMGVSIAASSW